MVKQLDTDINRVLRRIDLYKLSEKPRKAVAELKQSLIDARRYAQGYEYSETREEQLDNAKAAKKWLAGARAQILKASEFDIFGPIDVAHLTAQIDQLKADLK